MFIKFAKLDCGFPLLDYDKSFEFMKFGWFLFIFAFIASFPWLSSTYASPESSFIKDI